MTDKIKTTTTKLGIHEAVDITPLTPFQLAQVEKLINERVAQALDQQRREFEQMLRGLRRND